MPVTRDIAAEQRALKTYQGIYKKNPSSSSDWDALHNLAYPAASGGLPDEFKKASVASLGGAGINTPASNAIPPLGQTVESSNLSNLQAEVGTAKDKLSSLSNPNEALTILQNAIRTKSGVMEQPLGTSNIFESAGLTGIGALNASLSSQTQKYQDDYSNSLNFVKAMGGTYKDMAEKALANYNNSYTAFKDESNRLQKIQDDINQHKDAIDTMNQQYLNNVKLEAYKNSHPSVSDITSANEAGLVNVNGKWQPKIDTIFKSPSGDTYDVAKYAQLNDGTPNPEHIANMDDAVQKMKTMFPESNGQIKSIEDIDKFIQQYYPGSPITGQVVANAAGKYGIDWETILATMAAETQMGTDNSTGSKQNNFGNVGNTNVNMVAGKTIKMNNVQDGVDAVAKTMGLPYYKRNQISETGEDFVVDPNSKSILVATGLSVPAFNFLTQGVSSLTRMSEKSRKQYMDEAEKYLNKNGVDIATFKNQYEALGKTVEANSLRNNQAEVSQNELQATIDNLRSAANEAGLKKLKGLNIAKILAGKELNDPKYTTYLMHLQQLRNEFAMYNAAVGGQLDANGNIREGKQYENEQIANRILQDGMAEGSIDGFEKALNASREKMKVVLENSVESQNKQVWKLFGVEDKFQESKKENSTPPISSGTASTGNKFTITKE